MRTWAKQLQEYSHAYVRRGGKEHRRKQIARLENFLEQTDAAENLTSLKRLGKRQVINFWKANRAFSEKTAYDYWIALCLLWVWLEKPDKPPKPFFVDAEKTVEAPVLQPVDQLFSDFNSAIHSAREAKSVSLWGLANQSGIEAAIISDIERGDFSEASAVDIQNLLRILNIQLTFKDNS